MADVQVHRILSCRTHYEVLQLNDEGPPEFVETSRVRRRYKELAILVHPDKNRDDGAEAAFKRLSEAYECLLEEGLQREYLNTLQAPQTRSKANKHKRKRTTHSGPVTADARPTQPKRQRTPEEVWQQFHREEEEMAKTQFLSKGFDRVYESKSGDKSNAEKPSQTVSEEQQQEILDSGLDAKARTWMSWNKAGKVPTNEDTKSVSEAIGGDSTAPKQLISCMLCRRKFPTSEALDRHKALSKLHLANMNAHSLK